LIIALLVVMFDTFMPDGGVQLIVQGCVTKVIEAENTLAAVLLHTV
jgi:hypothetical protein